MTIDTILSNLFPSKKFKASVNAIKTVSSPMEDKDYKLDKAQEELFDLIENTHTNGVDN